MRSAIGDLAWALKESRHTVVLTGAGISTESGIPDFRSSKGLCRNLDTMKLLSTDTLYHKPDVFYTKGLELLNTMRGKKPNAAHKSLTHLEKSSLINIIITQNIDGLHHQSGSHNILEIHGNLRTCSCNVCHTQTTFEFLTKSVEKGIIPPKCECGGVLRPDVVFFGDPMPECFGQAILEAHNADLMLVVGSSLQVAPVAHLPSLARQMAIINLESTPYDSHALTVVHDKAGTVLTKLWEYIKAHF